MHTLTSTQSRIEKLTMSACGISRADILTADALRASIAAKIGGVIIHRINFPKALAGKVSPQRKALSAQLIAISKTGATVLATPYRKSKAPDKVRPMLTPEEEADAKQTTALALVATGALERLAMGGRMTLADWKVCFRAVRGPECLRIDRRAKSGNEVLSIDSLTPEETDYIAARECLPQLPKARRAIIARKVRYTRALCFAAFEADASRNRLSNLRKALRFVAFLCSQYQANGAHGIAEVVNSQSAEADALLTALRVRKARFVDYIAKGESALTAQALERTPEERTLRTFADLPSMFAIAD